MSHSRYHRRSCQESPLRAPLDAADRFIERFAKFTGLEINLVAARRTFFVGHVENSPRSVSRDSFVRSCARRVHCSCRQIRFPIFRGRDEWRYCISGCASCAVYLSFVRVFLDTFLFSVFFFHSLFARAPLHVPLSISLDAASYRGVVCFYIFQAKRERIIELHARTAIAIAKKCPVSGALMIETTETSCPVLPRVKINNRCKNNTNRSRNRPICVPSVVSRDI